MAMESGFTFFYAGHYRDNHPIPVHSHWGTELVYTARGKCLTHFANGDALETGEGMVCVTPPDLEHQQINLTPDCQTYYAVMQVREPRFDVSLRTIDAAGDPLVARWFRDLLDLWNDQARDAADALLAALWLRLETHEEGQRGLRDNHPGLRNALAVMEKRFREPISVGELARAACLSRGHLSALFHQKFKTGVAAHLTSIRMRHARRLLLNPYYNIAEIAANCGYADANYFSRTFRRFHGLSPGRYRKHPNISSKVD